MRGLAVPAAIAAAAVLLCHSPRPAVAQTLAPGDVVGRAASVAPRVTLAQLPLAFEPNSGQAPDDVRYVSQAAGYRLSLAGNEARFTAGNAWSLRLRWIGGAPAPSVGAEDPRPGRTLYHGGSPGAMPREVVSFGRVTYRDVYPGVDLVFRGTQRDVEFDFVVRPGADPRMIALEVDEADDLAVEGRDLVARRGEARLRLREPVVYQEGSAGRIPVDGRFRLDGRRIVFDIGAYDATKPLVIDPVVTYSTYYGSASGMYEIGTDAAGNFYAVAGAHVIKLSADGTTQVYSVVFGDAIARAGAIDAAGNAYVAFSCPYPRSGFVFNCPFGSSLASGRPQSQGDSGAYIAKLDPTGTMLFSTSMGGIGSVTPVGVAVDQAGNFYVLAHNVYSGFPTTARFVRPGVATDFPTVVEAIAADYSHFIYVDEITASGDGAVNPTGIAVDPTGAVYITGNAGSLFPTTSGAYQVTPTAGPGAGFVAKIVPGGSQLAYATFLGDVSVIPQAITADAAGNAYITGFTGAGLPAVNALQPGPVGGKDAFVTKVGPDGSALVFSTFLGGRADDGAVGIGLDGDGNVYVAGGTDSTDFPQVNPLPSQFGTAGSNFVTALTPAGNAFLYSTYFGDAQTLVTAMTVTRGGAVYLGGSTTSTSYPTVNPYQAGLTGTQDAIFARIENSATNCGTGQFFAEYFANVALTPPATRTACEGSINYDYGAGGPAGLPVDNFSVRWTGRFAFNAGSVVFSARADDGVRVFLDGTLVIDGWRDQPATTYSTTQAVTAGEHEVRVEYYERTGDASIQVAWTNGAGTPPAVSTLTPNTTAAGGPPFTLIVDGSGFVSGSRVYWNGYAVPTTFSGATRLTAGITTFDIRSAGALPVFVVNPDGERSNIATFTVTPGASCGAGQFFAQYFANTTLAPPSQLTGCEAMIDHDWGTGGPSSALIDNFSARWTGTFTFPGGPVTFTATADDGVRLYVDGAIVIDGWKDQPPTTYSTTRTLTAGDHQVIVEYYERLGGASIHVAWMTGGATAPTLTGLIPSTATAGGPSFTLNVDGTNFVAGTSTSGTFVPGTTIYWNGSPRGTAFVSPTRVSANIAASDIAAAGSASVTVRNPDGQVSNALTFTINPAGSGCSTGQFFAEYFANLALTPPSTRTACETAINYDWGAGGPAGLPVDNFSIRWTGRFAFPAGTVTFTVRADDGVRLYVDGTLVIDGWRDQPATTYARALSFASAAEHEVKVEYYEHGGSASVQASWTGGGTPPPVISSLTPSSAVAGGSSFSLIATGSSFVSGATILWNGLPRTTSFSDSTRLSAVIGTSDIASPGTVSVTVQNPDGQASNAVNFTVTPASACTAGQFYAQYFPNTTLNPPAARTACETAINYDWGAGGPPGLPTDNFSASWTGRFTLAAGTYTFTARADDGVRVTVDGVPIIDAWRDQPATTYTASLGLVAGDHDIGVVYYEHTGDAVIQVSWVNTGGGAPPPSVTTLTPGAATAGDPGFTLTVDGTNFVSGATVLWNGAARPTTFVGTTRVTAGISSADVAAPGSVPVSVRNPDGQTSGTRTFTVMSGTGGGTDTVNVFITAPADNTTVRGTVWFTVWLENAAAGSKTVTLSVNGTAITSTSTTSNGPISLPWSTTTADNGARTPTVSVRDSAGSTGHASITLTVAN